MQQTPQPVGPQAVTPESQSASSPKPPRPHPQPYSVVWPEGWTEERKNALRGKAKTLLGDPEITKAIAEFHREETREKRAQQQVLAYLRQYPGDSQTTEQLELYSKVVEASIAASGKMAAAGLSKIDLINKKIEALGLDKESATIVSKLAQNTPNPDTARTVGVSKESIDVSHIINEELLAPPTKADTVMKLLGSAQMFKGDIPAGANQLEIANLVNHAGFSATTGDFKQAQINMDKAMALYTESYGGEQAERTEQTGTEKIRLLAAQGALQDYNGSPTSQSRMQAVGTPLGMDAEGRLISWGSLRDIQEKRRVYVAEQEAIVKKAGAEGMVEQLLANRELSEAVNNTETAFQRSEARASFMQYDRVQFAMAQDHILPEQSAARKEMRERIAEAWEKVSAPADGTYLAQKDLVDRAVDGLKITDDKLKEAVKTVYYERVPHQPTGLTREDKINAQLDLVTVYLNNLGDGEKRDSRPSVIHVTDAWAAATLNDFKGAQKSLDEGIAAFAREQYPNKPEEALDVKMKLLAAQSALHDYTGVPIPETKLEEGQSLAPSAPGQLPAAGTGQKKR